MKSRMMISMLVIALTAALIGGATMAYFTDSASVANNTLAAGTLDVSLTNPDAAALPIQVSNMAPGDPATIKYLSLNNDGTLPMLFRFYMTGVGETDTLQDALWVKITLNPSDKYPRTFAEGEKRQGANDQFVWEGYLKDMIGAEKAITNVAAADHGYPLPADYSDIYKIEVSLPAVTGNEFQGDTFHGTLVVDAVQSSNQDVANPANVHWN